MILKYDIDVDSFVIRTHLKKITNLIYKLLPNREEGLDWRSPLSTIIEELAGMSKLVQFNKEDFFSLLCKLEGLYTLTEEEDFFLYRRTIFECLSIVEGLMKSCQD